MTKIENLVGRYTLHGVEKVKALVSELEDAIRDITVSVVWIGEESQDDR